jgi:hypothetical protein
MQKTVDGSYVIVGDGKLRLVFDWMGRYVPPDRAKPGSYEVVVEQEPGSGGKESAENTIRNLAGFKV